VNRRRWMVCIGCSLAALAPDVVAQKRQSPPTIGLLWIDSPTSGQFEAKLREGLQDRGYQIGRDVNIDNRSLVTAYEHLAGAAERLVRADVAVMVVYGSTAVQAAVKASPTIPIVMVASGDPVGLGVAATLARPGGNVTGLTTQGADLAGKRLQILGELVPGLRRFAVVLYPGSTSEVQTLRNYEALARVSNMEARPVEIRGPADIESAIATIGTLNVQGIVVVGSSLFRAYRDRIVAAIGKLRLPAMYSGTSLVEAGGLIALSPDAVEDFYRSASYVDKILKGAKPAEMPIEQPTKFELVVNLKAAKALGFTFPQSVLLRADRAIQ